MQDDEATGTDYDADEDGLIDIDSLAKFNAMRWDLDGNGVASGGGVVIYDNAFPGAAAGMGCPDGSDPGDVPDLCQGYELTSDLDFDTDGSGATYTGDSASPVPDANDAYYNGGLGWEPIGSRTARFNTTFDGRGHVIANLYNQRGANDVGVFGATGTSARIQAVGFKDLRVRGWDNVGAVVAHHQGRIAGVWVTGNVHGGNTAGGLVAIMGTAAVVVASYSRASVHATQWQAGLVGWTEGTGSTIRTSYSTGTSGATDGFSRGSGTVVASYWDTTLNGISDDSNNTPPEGRTSAQLQAPTGATGLYAAWDDQDVDGDGESGEAVDDDAWDFGTSAQHPVLKFGGFDTAVQFNLQPPNFGAGTVSNITNARTGVNLSVQFPAATHAGTVTYTVAGLPPGMALDADGTGTCSALRTICGAPTRTGTFTVIVTAANADGSASSTLSFQITVGGVEVDAVATTPAVVEAGPIALDEDTNGTTSQNYRVRLTSAPTGTVTVTFASADSGAVAVDANAGTGGVQTTLSFTSSTWSSWQTASVSIVEDTDFLDETVAITHAASGGGYNGQTATLTVTVADDEPAPEVLVDANPNTAAIDPGPLVLRENSAPSRNYLVRLSSQPPTSATVTLSSDNAAVTVAPGQLTFTNANWNTGQTVTATTTGDSDAVDEAADVVHALERTDSATTLRVGVRDAQRTGTDYDTDEDGLIEIDSLAKLNAMRWDLDGNGTASAGNATSYATAFPTASAGMGCPDRGEGAPEPCVGYELTRDLDFAGSAWASGLGWDPIGPNATPTDATHFNTVFDGNGHVIRNLVANRNRNYVGLFAALRPNAVVRTLGLPGVQMNGRWSVGALAGQSWGRVAGVWVAGRVRASGNLGGLLGAQQSGGSIAASYSAAAVECTTTGAGTTGGLVGVNLAGGSIAASYAMGAVTGPCSGQSGLTAGPGAVTASYWDTTLTGIDDDQDADPPEGRSTTQLQTPTQYGASGPYADWDDHDVDGNGTSDDAWHFGTALQHPVLKFAGFATATQFALQAPSFGSTTAPTATLRTGVSGNIQIPPAVHPGAVSYVATGLPPGMAFGGACGGARNICGRPTRAGMFAVTVWAANAAGARTRLDFTLDVGGIEIDADARTPQVESGAVALAEDAANPARSRRYAVRLTSAPTGAVTVALASSDTGAVTVDADPATPGLQNRLTFNTTNWNTPQTATLAAVPDADGADERATITHTASSGGYSGQSAALTATVADDGTPAVVVDTAPTTTRIETAPLTLAEATTESKNYRVYLSARPTATVRVAVASSDTGAARLNRSQLSFTTTNWRTPQTVRVTAQADGDAIDERAVVTHVASGAAEYVGVSAQIGVLVQDDETHSGDYDDDDNGLIDIRTLAQLDAMRWDLNGDGQVGAGDAANYATAFPNAVSGMGCPAACSGYELRRDLDFDTDGDGSTWTEANGAVIGDADDAYYDDGAGWVPIGTNTSPFATRLKGNGHLIRNLFIDRSGARNAGLFGEGTWGGRLEAVGVVDAYVRGGIFVGILSGAAGGMPIVGCYTTGQVIGVSAGVSVLNPATGGLVGYLANHYVVGSYSMASVVGHDRVGGLIGWHAVAGGVTNSYALGPSTVAASQVGGLVGLHEGGPVSASYWDRETAYPIGPVGTGLATVDLQRPTAYGATGIYSAWDDQDMDGDSMTGAAADPDDDAWDFGTSQQYPALKFAGFDTASQFNAQPPSFRGASPSVRELQTGVVQSVAIPSAFHGSAAVTYSAPELPPGLQFDADGTGACGAARTVCGTPTAAGTYAVVVRATAAGGSSEELRFTVTVVEGIQIDAIPGTPAVDPGPLALRELSGSNSGSYSVRLLAEPSASTTVTIVSADTGAVTVDTSTTSGLQDTLTFTTMNWNTPQTVTLAAVQDDDPVDETVVITHTASGGLDSTAYLTATVADDEPQRKLLFDVAPATAAIDAGPLLLEEGATPGREYAVKLPQAPTAAVTVTVASRSGAVTADTNTAAGVQNLLTFTTMNWDTWQTVTATAAEDDDAVDEATGIDHVASGAAEYAGVTTTLRVGIGDDERAGTDYDADEDGLIDVDSLAKLNAVRWDLDGDGVAIDAAGYESAFPDASVAMGCPDGDDPDGLPDPCAGYELTRDLDFDTDGDGATYTLSGATATGDSDDAYDNGGAGWEPIGQPSLGGAQFDATFDGNGHVVRNLFVNRGSRNLVGLFSALRSNAVVRALGLPGARVIGNWSTAPLVGENVGRVAAVWASGAAQGLGNVGGLVGVLRPGGTVVASYSTAAAACTGTMASHRASGLVGGTDAGGSIAASYSTGAVTGTCPGGSKFGFTTGGTVAASYWDATLSGINDDGDANPPEGRTTAQLQAPTSATGIYAAWDDQDVDGDGRSGEALDDDAWDFGTATQHPVLKFGGLDTALQFNSQGTDSAPDFGSASVGNKTFPQDLPILPFRIPAATGGNGALVYAADGLPDGLAFDSDGSGACQIARAVCGTPTTSASAATVTITVTDNDDNTGDRDTLTFDITVTAPSTEVGTVLIDADLGTPETLDPGPLFVDEGDGSAYSVRLSAQPTATVTVAVASGDTGALTVDRSSLTFTTQNWATAQTVGVTAVAESTDAVDESVDITHTPTGGGYSAAATLRVAVSDAERTNTDYDTDENGLIEVSTLAQLNAIRWDLNGDGTVAAGNQSNYDAAFGNASTGMGCPTGGCSGYELVQDLDFDTDGDGSTWSGATPASDSDDTYHNSGNGWDPIGANATPSDTMHFNAVFDGNGHSIHNLFANGERGWSGLFAALRGSAVVRSLGLPNAHVRRAFTYAGALAGENWGRVEAVWTTGAVAANDAVGGLVGRNNSGATIVASYSTAAVECVENDAANVAGGLTAQNGGAVTASYATGSVTGACPTAANKHGFAGGSGTATASYWDAEASAVATSGQGVGRTTAQLQGPTSATGIYAGWDRLDVDGDGSANEAPWHFGTESQYPVLSHRSADPVPQRGDYDLDDNGLIEVYTLAQLNAIRWDMDGNGAPASGNAADYAKAFRNHVTGMGCRSAGCYGYELENDLDFDTDGDGSTHTNGVGDSGDAYWNGGNGWDPIGPFNFPTATTHFAATFDGQGHAIANLLSSRNRGRVGLFSALHTTARVHSLALPRARVSSGASYAGALAGHSRGRVAGVWTTGSVQASSFAGGLVGWLQGTMVATYSNAAVECTLSNANAAGGGLVGNIAGTVAASYATGAVTGGCGRKGGLGYVDTGGSVTASYWDVDRSGIDDDSDGNPPEGVTSANLRMPTDYTGIYATWDDQDVDGDNSVGRMADADDDAWDFGGQWQWPALKFGGLDVAGQIALQPNVAPTFGTGSVTNKTYRKDHEIATFQVPAASGGEGTGYTYSASGLPAGLVFEGVCGARRICGTPTANTVGPNTVTIYAHDGDTNREDTDRAVLTFTISVVTPTAVLAASNRTTLTEDNLDDAEATVTLTDATFASGVALSHFVLSTNVPGLTIDGLATVAAGDTTATLTLDYTGADFTAVRTLSVTVAAAAHNLPGTIASSAATVTPTPGIALSPAMLTVEEDPNAGGGTNRNVGTYTMRLIANPRTETGGNCSVVVTATSNNTDVSIDTDATPQTLSLTFTQANWNTRQAVTVTAASDNDSQDDAATVSHLRVGGCAGGFFGTPTLPGMSVTVNDDETPAILLDANPATPGMDEAGPLTLDELSTSSDNSKSYTARLSAEPTQTVTVTIASGDTTSVTVGDTDGDSMNGVQNTLTFTTANWNTPRTVTLTAEDDNDGIGENVTITHTASTATPSEYTNVQATLTAAVTDEEAPGFVFDADPTSPATNESGPLLLEELSSSSTNSASYTVRLTSQPTQTVTATLTSSDATAVTVGDTDTDTPGDQNTLTFTATNWNTVQTVTLSAQQDDGAANESVTITHAAATTTNSEYTDVSGEITATVDDDETPAITLSASALSVPEENSSDYTVRLATPPEGGNVVVTITGAGDGITASPTSLTFTSTNWNTLRTVRVTAANDQDGMNETATLVHAASGGEYDDAANVNLDVTATDDDTPSLRVTPTTLEVDENSSGMYTIRLNTRPTASVTVTVSGASGAVTVDTDAATGNQDTLIFTQTTWSAVQTVAVAAADDGNAVNEMLTLAHAASGGDYAGLASASRPSVQLTVDDDDMAGILIDADLNTLNDQAGPVLVNELSTASNNTHDYTVRLSSEPTQDATITIVSNLASVTVGDTDGDSLNGVQNTLTFTSTNWNTPRTVTLTAAEDDNGVGESATITHTSSTSSASEYTNLMATLTANTTDDDAPSFVFDADPDTANDQSGPLALNELSSSSTNSDDYTVRLYTQPTRTVTATITSNTPSVTVDDTDGDSLNGVQNTLTFTSTNWNTPQTVTLTAQQDDNGFDESATITHRARTTPNSEYTNVNGTFMASVTDDETPAITLSATTLTVPEQDSRTYTVRLATEPVGGNVTVDVTGAADGLSASPTRLVFTTGSWDTERTVRITAANDQDGDSEVVTFSHAASGADYGSVPTAALVATSMDNDTPSLQVTPTTLEVDENNSGRYRIRLNTQPSATVTVTVSGATGAVTVDTATTSGDQNTLTFTTTTWRAHQTVTVAAGDDGNAVNEMLTLTHAASGGDYGGLGPGARPSVQLTVDDDDMAGILIDADPNTPNDQSGPLALAELSTASNNSVDYTVRLSSEPTQDATVTITSNLAAVTVGDTDGDSLNGVQNTLTFTATNWNTPRTVTLTAAEDDNGVPESATITHTSTTATQSEYTNLTAPLTANTTDDDTPSFVFDADPDTANDQSGPLQLNELSSSSTNSDDYTVRLYTQPTRTVTATITSNTPSITVADTDGDSLNGVQNTLTFTSTNWSTPQTVTLTAQQDDNGFDETATITHRARTTPSSEYTNVNGTFTASVNDDETPAIVLSASALTVPEQNSATYTVRLDTEPAGGNATVDITGAADGITASPTRLVFTAYNWNTARQVRVTAANDDDSDNEVVTLSHAASGADYGSVPAAEIVVTSTDDDTPSLRVSPTQLPVRENRTAAYTMRLNTLPSATVTVTISGTTAEVTVDADPDTSGDQTALTFTATNWNANRTVTVSAADDPDATDETVNLLHTATGGDYTGLALASRPGVTVSVDDDDTPAILLDADPDAANDQPGPLALNEMAGHADNVKNYTVRLATEPTAQVEVEVSSGDRAVSVHNDATPRTRTLTFTTTNWATVQTVMATAAEDDDASDEPSVAISHTATGGDYENVSAQLFASTVDDDEPAIVVGASALIASGVAEGGEATYTVRLDTEPAGVARVAVAATGPVSVDLDRHQAGVQPWLRFDATNWNTPRTAQVRGLEDADAAAGMATLRHTSSGADYGRAPAVDVQFAVSDNDTPQVLADATSVDVNESSTAAYSVTLAAAPTGGTVEVTPTSSDEAVATVSPTTLRFTSSNWNAPQRVTVRGVSDGAANITHPTTGADYGTASTPTVTATVRDEDAPGVRVEPPLLRLAEGAMASYRVRLNTQPSGDVTVTATSGSSELTLRDGAQNVGTLALTFTTGNWNADQEVRAESIADDDVDDDSTTVTHSVAGYAGVSSAPTLAVEVEDDDAPGIAFDPAEGLSLTEGGAATDTYTAVLTARPSADVTVTVSSDDAGLAFDTSATPGDQTTLTFTTLNWNDPQTVTARAETDGDAATEEAVLLHTAAGGGYDGVTAEYDVQVSDADAAPAPARVSASSAGTTSLAVSWSASPGAYGYWVQWRRVGEEWSLDRLIEVPGAGAASAGVGGGALRVATGPLSARIDGLREGVVYEVRVRALNRGDPGSPSPTASATPRAPSAGGNRAPEIVAVPEIVLLPVGGQTELDLSALFAEPDGDALSYSAVSADPEVASATVAGSVLSIFGGRPGNAAIAVTAEDPQGLSARLDIRVGVIGTACSTEPAQAPEGGTAVVVAELTSAVGGSTTLRWHIVRDEDPATPDADAGDHGDASGEVEIHGGERCAEIEIPILDDAVAEPAREWFTVEMRLRYNRDARLVSAKAQVAVLEGVCDRAPAVRRALTAATDADRCEQPAPTDLRRVRTLDLANAGLGALAAEDMGGLSGLRMLNLSGNGLEGLPALPEATRLEHLLLGGNALEAVPLGALPAPERLRGLTLSDNALADLSADAFAAVPGLRSLRLDGNQLRTLPEGLFAGLGSLRMLRLDGNPGAPFAVPVHLKRMDAEPCAAAPATLRATMPLGAPFEAVLGLSAEGGTFAGGSAESETTVPAGETASASFAVDSAAGFARVSLTVPALPARQCLNGPCWQGFALEAPAPLALFARAPRVLAAPEPDALFGEGLRVALSSLAEAGEPGGELEWSVRSSDPTVARARILGGYLLVEPEPGGEGVVQVEATATDRHGQTATVRFEVRVEFHWPSSTRSWRRVIQSGGN